MLQKEALGARLFFDKGEVVKWKFGKVVFC